MVSLSFFFPFSFFFSILLEFTVESMPLVSGGFGFEL